MATPIDENEMLALLKTWQLQLATLQEPKGMLLVQTHHLLEINIYFRLGLYLRNNKEIEISNDWLKKLHLKESVHIAHMLKLINRQIHRDMICIVNTRNNLIHPIKDKKISAPTDKEIMQALDIAKRFLLKQREELELISQGKRRE